MKLAALVNLFQWDPLCESSFTEPAWLKDHLLKKTNLSAAKIVCFLHVLAADVFLSAAKILYLKCVLAVDKLVLLLAVVKEKNGIAYWKNS